MNCEESEVSSASHYNQTMVNISVPRNHLKLNVILRILMCFILLGNILFVPWLRDQDCNMPEAPRYVWNHNPAWLYHDGELYFYFQLVDHYYWNKKQGFKESFWNQVPFIFLSGFFTLFVALVVFIFEILAILSILNIVFDYKVAWFRVSFFQRQNYLFIITTIIVWFWWQTAWGSIQGLSYGFYTMIGIVVSWILLKFYYRYYKSKLYKRRIINELLKN